VCLAPVFSVFCIFLPRDALHSRLAVARGNFEKISNKPRKSQKTAATKGKQQTDCFNHRQIK